MWVDTDHFSELERNSAAGRLLAERLAEAPLEKCLTVVTVEEKLRGWLAEIHRLSDPHRQIAPYAKLQRQVEAFGDWLILPWDAGAAELFLQLRRQGVRIGSMDLRIACMTLVYDSTLLTHFAKVPGLRFENWLERPSAQ